MSRKRAQRIKLTKSEDDSEDEEIPRKRSKKPSRTQDKENTSENVNIDIEMLEEPPVQRTIIMRNLQGNIAAELKSGKIKKISLKNFMCHANFEVELNHCVNIFMGLNGSGKSAILTAIAIGLGSKASATARSTNLKDLVRRGETAATIEITLTNDGIDAYDEETYGKEIIVIRHINANTGASTYKIKNQQGRVISNTRQDLMKLTMCMNIQVENPVLILNQDAARSFLKECDPKKLFSFFMKATQIETIIEKLNSCLLIAVSSKNRLETMGKAIKHTEGELEVLREKHGRLQSVARLHQRIDMCHNELEWLQITNLEKELQLAQTNLTNSRDSLKKIKDFINNKTKFERDTKDNIRSMGTEIENLRVNAQEKSKSYESSRIAFEEERDKLSAGENKLKGYLRASEQINENVLQLENDISEHEKNPNSAENARRVNEAKKAAIEKRHADALAMLQNSKRDHQMFNETLFESKERLDEFQEKIQRENVQRRILEQQIEQFKRSGKDQMMAYGASMTKLLNEVERLYQHRKFSELPRGPIGRYIEVPDKKYRSAVENILDRTLLGFIVNSDKDRLLLKELLGKYNDLKFITIIQCQFQKQIYNINEGIVKIDERIGKVLFNMIKVDDPVVLNCLIDQKSIERIVLVDNMESAIELTLEENNVPENLSRVVLLNPYSEFHPAPSYRTYSLRENPVRYIQTNTQDLIKNVEEQKNRIQDRLAGFNNQIKEMHQKARDQEKLVVDKKRIINEIQQQLTTFTRELQNLKDVEYPEETDVDFKRTLLAEESEKKGKVDQRAMEFKKKLEVQQDIVNRYKKKMSDLEDKHRETRNKIADMQHGIEEAQINLNEMKSDVKSKTNQIAVLNEEENKSLKLVTDLQKSTEELKLKARGNRIDCNRPVDDINSEIRSTEKHIERIESNHEKIEDIEVCLDGKIKEVEDQRKIYVALDNILKKLGQIRESRYQYIRRLRSHMILRIQTKFCDLMCLKGYSAEMEVNTKEKELKLKIIPRDGNIEGAVSNTKSLSGGERSYSTVSFLIALWSCVDHPFYFLDEYDVFSDEYNRFVMTQLLLNEAAKKPEKQYGFLTPQEIPNIKLNDSITIHKLDDPDRKQ